MRIEVPEAVSVRGEFLDKMYRANYSPHNPDPDPSVHYIVACDLPDHRYVIEREDYFYNTHGLPMNTCVHSKLLQDGEAKLAPNLVDSRGYIYSPRHTKYDGPLMWASNPFVTPPIPREERLITRVPGSRIINNKSVGVYLHIPDFYNYRSGVHELAFQIDYYVARPKEKQTDYDKVYYRRHTLYVSMEYTCTASTPDFPVQVITLRYTGSHRQSGPSIPIPDNVFDQLGTLYSGISKTYYRGSYEYCLGNVDSLCESMLDVLERACKTWDLDGYMSNPKWNKWSRASFNSGKKALDLPDLVEPHDRFLLGEIYLYAEGLDPLLLDYHGLPNYWRNVLVQNAYLDALDTTPRLNDNSISNILELVGFVKSLVIDHKVEIPKSLGDAWLSYRYVYTTTKLDAEEAISFVHRHCDLGTLDQWIHCFGASEIDYHNDRFSAHIKCRCGLEIRPKDIAMFGKVWRALYTYGLQPNFYVVWDSIPYSFIIDWFIPIGNLAHALDAGSMYDGTYYEIKDVVFSLSYDIQDEYYNTYHQYTRWTQDGVPQLNGFYFLEEDPASTKVMGMRALDVLSLFIGKGKKHGKK